MFTRFKNKLILVSVLMPVLMVSSFISIAEERKINQDAVELANLLSKTLTYEAQFTQSVYRENSDKAEITTGTFLIQRPDHFKWKTLLPYQQEIIADGDHLWTFDPELEQVTIQNQQSVLADSPLLLLTSSVGSLVDAFEIKKVSQKDDSEEKDSDIKDSDKKNSQKSAPKDKKVLFALTPRENSLFESVHILIEEQKIKEFFLVDTLGGRTSVIFQKIKLNDDIDVKEFIFNPPEGVDIIDSREFVN